MSKTADKLMAELIADYFQKHLSKIEEMVALAVARILKMKITELSAFLEKRVTELAKPGRDADEQRVIDAVLARIVLPSEEKILGKLVEKIPSPIHGSPDTGFDIKKKLLELPIKERWFDEKHIKNLEEFIRKLITEQPSFGGILRGGMETVKSEPLAPTQSGANITLDLTQLSTSWSRIVGVFKNGLKQNPEVSSGWTRSGNTITVYNATAESPNADEFIVDYVS